MLANRALTDGTWGMKDNPFEQEIIDQVEWHQFPAVKALYWRNRA